MQMCFYAWYSCDWTWEMDPNHTLNKAYFFTYLTIFLAVCRNLPVHIISAIDVPTSICGILLALILTSVSLQRLYWTWEANRCYILPINNYTKTVIAWKRKLPHRVLQKILKKYSHQLKVSEEDNAKILMTHCHLATVTDRTLFT